MQHATIDVSLGRMWPEPRALTSVDPGGGAMPRRWHCLCQSALQDSDGVSGQVVVWVRTARAHIWERGGAQPWAKEENTNTHSVPGRRSSWERGLNFMERSKKKGGRDRQVTNFKTPCYTKMLHLYPRAERRQHWKGLKMGKTWTGTEKQQRISFKTYCSVKSRG